MLISLYLFRIFGRKTGNLNDTFWNVIFWIQTKVPAQSPVSPDEAYNLYIKSGHLWINKLAVFSYNWFSVVGRNTIKPVIQKSGKMEDTEDTAKDSREWQNFLIIF